MEKFEDIADNVLQLGKEGIRQNMLEALGSFCDIYADEAWKAVEEVIRLRKIVNNLQEKLKAEWYERKQTRMALEYAVLDQVPPDDQYMEEWIRRVEMYLQKARAVVQGDQNSINITVAKDGSVEVRVKDEN